MTEWPERSKYVEGTPPGLMTGILLRLHAAGSAELNVNGLPNWSYRAAGSCAMTEWLEKSKYLERHTAGAHDRYLALIACSRQRRAEYKRRQTWSYRAANGGHLKLYHIIG